AGLTVPPLADATRERLAGALPKTATVVNPIDLVGDADAARYGDALHALGPDAADLALLVLTPQATTDALGVARAIIGATRDWPIPRAAAFVGGGRVAAGAPAPAGARLPLYPVPRPGGGGAARPRRRTGL